MSHRFLSPDWFDEVARIQQELELPQGLQGVCIDLEVTDAPEGTIQAHIDGVAIRPGFAAAAATKLRLAYGVAQQLLVSRDVGAALRAYMTGQLKIEGEFEQLIAVNRAAEAPESRRLIERISAITS